MRATNIIRAVGACASHEMLLMLGNKWTVLTMGHLLVNKGTPVRFSELKAALPGISQRMLTAALRRLERDGLVVRYYHPDIPPRVEYELTDVGLEMLEALEVYGKWMKLRWPEIEESRRRYDGLSSADQTGKVDTVRPIAQRGLQSKSE